MIAFTVNGNGNTCASITNTGNGVPRSTPGSMAGGAGVHAAGIDRDGSDPDGDAVSYNGRIRFGSVHRVWGQQPHEPFRQPANFQVVLLHTSPIRTLPRAQDLVNNSTTIGEHLPTYSRQLNFKCSIRDNRAGRWLQRRLENDERHRQCRSIFGPISQRGWHLVGTPTWR